MPVLAAFSRLAEAAALEAAELEAAALEIESRPKVSALLNDLVAHAFWRLPGGRVAYKRFPAPHPFPTLEEVKHWISTHYSEGHAYLCLRRLPPAYASRLRERKAWERKNEPDPASLPVTVAPSPRARLGP